jgi:hypothetical protein
VERISIMPGGMPGSTTTGMPENSMVFPNICSEARGRMSAVHSGLPSAWLRWLAIIAELVARHHEHGRRTEQLPAKVRRPRRPLARSPDRRAPCRHRRSTASPVTAGPRVEAIWWHPAIDDDPEHAHRRDAAARACAPAT